MNGKRFAVTATTAMVLGISAAWAQAQTVRVVGPVIGVDGPTIVVKQAKGDEARVIVTEKTQVFGVVNATLKDITPGSFIGVGATPQADGSQKAIRIMIFADVQRGTGEGHRPWNRPGTTMTNATVDSTVAGVDGQVIRVKYKGGEQRIVVGPDARIMAYVVGSRDELKPGANIAITNAIKRPDGSLETSRINVGRGDVIPD